MVKNSLLVVIIFLSLLGCSASDEDAADAVSFLADATVSYKTIAEVPTNLTSLDVYTVPNSKDLKPVVVWVHGGGWAIGDKLNNMDVKVPFFRDLGYVFVSVNYRLSPFPYELSNATRIKHPDHITDVADALKWVYNTISLYGGDKKQIVVLGHSAGAHLAALVGTNQTLLTSRSIPMDHIRGIGTFDTQAYNIKKAIASLAEDDLYINAFGDNEEIQNEASPELQIEEVSVLVKNWLLVKRGNEARREILGNFTAKLQSKNVSVSTIEAASYTHEEINSLIGSRIDLLMTQPIVEFLQSCFE